MELRAEPKIVKFGPVKVAGYLHKTSMSNNTIPAFWEEIMADGRQKNLHERDFVHRHSEYGI
jgi:predicted transcriptional regulator YdeE